MKSFKVKAIVFYSISSICALVIVGFTNVALYWFYGLAGLAEFGSLLFTRIGTAIIEGCLAVLCVSQLSEVVLYNTYDDDDEDEDTQPNNVFDEKWT